MQKFKVKDIYIIKPVKLEKQNKYLKYYFPYSILDKLGLLISNSEKLLISFKNNKSFLDKIKYKIAEKTPDYIHKAALICHKKYYTYDHENITFAIAKDPKHYKWMITEYKDVFKDSIYKTEKCFDYCGLGQNNNLIIQKKIYEPENLTTYLLEAERPTAKETSKEFQKRLEETKEREYSIAQLEQLKQKIISEEKDESYVVTIEETQNYVGAPFYNTLHAYDKEGNKIYPKTITKVKKTEILK